MPFEEAGTMLAEHHGTQGNSVVLGGRTRHSTH